MWVLPAGSVERSWIVLASGMVEGMFIRETSD